MAYENILTELKEGIFTIKINRPKALNALNGGVLLDLLNAMHEVRQNKDVKIVVITGEGEKAFVAGADIASMKEMTPLQAKDFCDLGHHVMRMIETARVPVIAAINGFALGGGLELALACDFIYASENAKLGLPEVNLGIFPGFGGSQRLPRLIGKNRARELIFTAKMLSAKEAHEWGLVNKVCGATELLKDVEVVAKEIMAKGPVAIELSKRAVVEGADLDLVSGLAIERALFPLAFATEDRVEGVTAFLEKRKAGFKGQ